MLVVPPTYDTDTFDRDGQILWALEPEPYNPNTYAAWSRKHFGDDWYEQRKTMLQEGDIYMDSDPVYPTCNAREL